MEIKTQPRPNFLLRYLPILLSALPVFIRTAFGIALLPLGIRFLPQPGLLPAVGLKWTATRRCLVSVQLIY